MAEIKTKVNNKSVVKFLKSINDEHQRQDCFTVLELMKKVTKLKPKMWGSSIVGFGKYHYKYESGHQGDCFVTGFSPRKQNITIYLMTGFDKYGESLKKLGKYKTGKSCLYIKKLEDIHLDVLKKMIKHSVEHIGKINRL
jgi:hypothetical protein